MSRIGIEFDREWRARFERFGRTHAAEHAVSGWSAEGLHRRVRLFEEVLGGLPLPARADVLELGCGAGTYVRYLAGLGHHAVGVDYAQSTLRRALGADPGRKGQYLAADGYDLPFGRESFDLVVCIGVLQALSRPGSLLDEIARVVRPRGIVVIEALNAQGPPALVRRLREILGNRPRRVRFYASFRVRDWLAVRGFVLLRRVSVYVPPRRLPGLGRLLDRPTALRVLDGLPGGALVGAHAFWLVGQKSGEGLRRGESGPILVGRRRDV